MSSVEHIENPDVILIGSGVMSATLGGVLKNLQPDLKIQLYEVTPELAQESSNGWNNAGTGHAGICELSYTPNRGADGEVDVAKAIEIFDQFEQSKYFWGYAVRSGMIEDPSRFVNAVPHIAFVYGQEQVDFLRSRHKGMSAHHFFSSMEYTDDRDTIREWAPLLLSGRDETPIAATKMDVEPHGGEFFQVQRLVLARVLVEHRQPTLRAAFAIEVGELAAIHLAVAVLITPLKDARLFLGKRLVEQRLELFVIGLNRAGQNCRGEGEE